MNPIAWLLIEIIDLYTFVVFFAVIVSILLQLGILNRSNQIVFKADYLLTKLTEPALSRIRKYLPPIAGMDFSPIVLFVALGFLRQCVLYIFYH